jgi:5'-methylthioadenosine/S-adenosylhomocysteine nucleosidase
MPYRSDFLNDVSQMQCIAVMAAMQEEEFALTDGVASINRTIGNRTTCHLKELQFEKRKVLVSQSGIGLVNAGVTLTLLSEHYPIDGVILLGVGGALDENLSIGDTVIATKVIQHDSIATRDHDVIPIAPGALTLSAPPDQQVDPIMQCDTILTQWLYDTFSRSSDKERILKGTILSGSEFVGCSERKLKIRTLDNAALLVDMEAAALCQISRNLGLPIGIAKTVADTLYPQKTISDDFKTFLSSAARHSHAVIQGLKALRAA